MNIRPLKVTAALVVSLIAFMVACHRRSTPGQAAQAAAPETAHFRVTIAQPPRVESETQFELTLTVVPLAGYKMNLE